jgi:hypothetical protein
MRANKMKVLIAFLTALFLTACGGGGSCVNCSTSGISGTSTSNVAVPLASAEVAIVAAGETDTMTVSGTVDGQAASGSTILTETPSQSTTLNNTPVAKSTETVTDTVTKADGTTATVTESSDIFTNPGTGAIVEEHRSDGTAVTFPPYTPPKEVAPGDSGTLANGTIYSDNNKTAVIGTEELSYSVEADTATDDKVTFEKKDKDNNGNMTRDEKKKYKIDDQGNSKLASRTIDGKEGGHSENLIENEQ